MRHIHSKCKHKNVSKMLPYKSWQSMIRRCYYPDKLHKKYYKDIHVCEEWLDSYNFCIWAINNGYEKGLTIDRIDIYDDYKPSNCRIVSKADQLKYNRRNLSKLTIKKETKTITEWAREYGIRENTIRMRIKYGWQGEKLLLPTKKYSKENNYWEGR